MNLESPKVTVEKPAQYIFDALTDVKHFEKLMPDSIAKFEVIGDDAFIFGLKGMPEIKLKMKEKVVPNKVVLGAAGDKLPLCISGTSFIVLKHCGCLLFFVRNLSFCLGLCCFPSFHGGNCGDSINKELRRFRKRKASGPKLWDLHKILTPSEPHVKNIFPAGLTIIGPNTVASSSH